MNYSLGIDVGSSSVKVAVVETTTGKFVKSATHPKTEMPMIALEKSWAEQEPQMWWDAFVSCLEELGNDILSNVSHIGISYQMHGLVCVDENHEVLRPSIIWCDSRAVAYGDEALNSLGEEYCLGCLLNSPGNFTASKLKWVKENEPSVFDKIYKVMLPGDYMSMRLSGKISTTITGLSEGIFWDFEKGEVSEALLKDYGFDQKLIPEFEESFSSHSMIKDEVADELGIGRGAKITYKAGDQPNNALSLNVLEPGEIAATAGTSGVVYGVVDSLFVDPQQRVNSFAHVNYTSQEQRIGVLLCINGVGISNAWVKRNFSFESYVEMNIAADKVAAGAEGLEFFPFGNGAERMLGNKDVDASIDGINYNIHDRRHFARAVQEGIAYSFAYGMEAFKEENIDLKKIKAGHANMFLSELFAQTISDLTGVEVELYNTDGAIGAARGALIGGKVLSKEEAFSELTLIKKISPSVNSPYPALYDKWKQKLKNKINE